MELTFEFSRIVNGRHFGYERHKFSEEELSEIIKNHFEDDRMQDGRIVEITN